MIIYGKNILLRGIEESDNEMLRGMLNDPETEHLTVGTHFPVSSAEQKNWFENFSQSANTKRLIIAKIDSNEPIGLAILSDINYANGSCESGIKVCSGNVREKGNATDALMALWGYAFDEMRMHRIHLTILDYNKASQNLHEKCGAKFEGTMREAIYKHGKYHNQLVYGVLYDEYLAARERNNWEPAVIRKA